nr:MAG TPA: hypothetical protein [Caudoviricetes sp.]
MVFNEMVEVCRGHFNNGRVEIFSAKSGRRHSNGGFQHFKIPESGSSAEMRELIIVNFNDFRKCQEKKFRLHLASSSKDFA